MKHFVLAAIRFYQRRISPYKGFCCAYRAHTGRAGCSMLGYRAIRFHGVWRGLGVLRERLYKCGVAHRRYGQGHARAAALHRQAGFCDLPCDLPCDGCDMPAPDADCVCDCLSNCPAGDCGEWEPWKSRKRKRQEEDRVHLPPQYKPGQNRG